MSGLVVRPNLADPDAVYEMLIQAHDGLDKAASDALNARLILILFNHVGDRDILRAALELARNPNGGPSQPSE